MLENIFVRMWVMGLSGEKWKPYDCVYICSRVGGCVLMGIVLFYEYIVHAYSFYLLI